MALFTAKATLDTSTISGNTARMGGGVYLGDTATTLQIGNSTIVNNAAPAGSGGGVYLHAGSAAIAQVTTFVFAGNPSAPVLTESAAATSPAVDSGDPAFAASVAGIPVGDQRHYVRVFGGRIDMGAVEVSPSADLSITESVIGGPTFPAGSAASFKIDVQNRGPGDAAAVIVTDIDQPFGTATFSASPSQGSDKSRRIR